METSNITGFPIDHAGSSVVAAMDVVGRSVIAV